MKVTIEQFKRGALQYFDEEILSKATGWNKFKYSFAVSAYTPKIESVIVKLKDNAIVKELDIFDKDSNIDLDKVYGWSKEAIKKTGSFEFQGIIFNESDIEKVYAQVKRQIN